MSVISILGAIVFLFLREPKQQKPKAVQSFEDHSQSAKVENMSAETLDRDITKSQIEFQKQKQKTEDEGLLLKEEEEQIKFQLHKNQDRIQDKEIANCQLNVKANKKESWKKKLIPLIVWGALSLATFAGSFVTMMTKTMDSYDWNQNKQLEMSLLAMIPLGVGEMIGSLIIGKIIDKYSVKTAIYVCITNLTSLMETRTDYFIYFGCCYGYAILALLILLTFKFKQKEAQAANKSILNQDQVQSPTKETWKESQIGLLQEDSNKF